MASGSMKSPFETKWPDQHTPPICNAGNFSVDCHRVDGLLCNFCSNWVCAWHYWAGDDDLPYCPVCAPSHRKDGEPEDQ